MTHGHSPHDHHRSPKNHPAHEAVVEAWVLANLPRLTGDDVVTSFTCDDDEVIVIAVRPDVHDRERPVVVTVEEGLLVVVHSDAVVARMRSERDGNTNSDTGMAMLSAVQAFLVRTTMAIVDHREHAAGGRS